VIGPLAHVPEQRDSGPIEGRADAEALREIPFHAARLRGERIDVGDVDPNGHAVLAAVVPAVEGEVAERVERRADVRQELLVRCGRGRVGIDYRTLAHPCNGCGRCY